MQKFVIISGARSGSNMLKSLLDEHSQIKCYGEIFNPAYGAGYVNWTKKSFYRHTLNKFLRDYSVETYLDSLFSQKGDSRHNAIGFKVMYPGQFNRCSIFRYYWWVNDFKIIRLTRTNLLRRFISSKIAVKEGVWMAQRERGNHLTVKIDTNELLQVFISMENKNIVIDSLAQEFDNIMLNYEEMVCNQERVIKSVYRFLSVDENEANHIKPRTAKQNSSDLTILIENYDEVYSALKETKYECFFKDE